MPPPNSADMPCKPTSLDLKSQFGCQIVLHQSHQPPHSADDPVQQSPPAGWHAATRCLQLGCDPMTNAPLDPSDTLTSAVTDMLLSAGAVTHASGHYLWERHKEGLCVRVKVPSG